MTTLGTRGLISWTIIKAQLNSIIAIPLGSTDLQHNARPRLNDSHRHNDAISIINLRHPNFSTQ
jgi:hypothetical protein